MGLATCGLCPTPGAPTPRALCCCGSSAVPVSLRPAVPWPGRGWCSVHGAPHLPFHTHAAGEHLFSLACCAFLTAKPDRATTSSLVPALCTGRHLRSLLELAPSTWLPQCAQSNQRAPEVGSMQHAARKPMGTGQSMPDHQSAVEHRNAAALVQMIAASQFGCARVEWRLRGWPHGGRQRQQTWRRRCPEGLTTSVPRFGACDAATSPSHLRAAGRGGRDSREEKLSCTCERAERSARKRKSSPD